MAPVHINRRDFLRLMALLPPSALLPSLVQPPRISLQDSSAKNILVVVFDAFSAQHMSFLGYPRQTMPNLSRIAEKATVYHNHHSAGNWTPPGTASLLTGTYPWSHRVLNQRVLMASHGIKNNLFTILDQYYRVAYTHNTIVNRLLQRMHHSLDLLKNQKDLFIANHLTFDRLFPWDSDIAPLSWDRIMARGEKGYTYSLSLAQIYQKYHEETVAHFLKDYPRGLPRTGEDSYFRLEDAIDWLQLLLVRIPQPFIGYFHFLPPHRQYNTRREFFNTFSKDDVVGIYVKKPRHPIFGLPAHQGPSPEKYEEAQRRHYDEYILYLDYEFGRLYEFMEKNGLLKNTWVIFTSDHGEMFERGIIGDHMTPLLYEPVTHIPLLIIEPSQQNRRDIYSATSAVDVLPTIVKLAGQQLPDWTEGTILPPFSEKPPSADRPIFALEAAESREDQPLSPGSLMMIKDKYKLTRYWGYRELEGIGDWYELYDLETDPQELKNLYKDDLALSRGLRDELMEKVKDANKRYGTS